MIRHVVSESAEEFIAQDGEWSAERDRPRRFKDVRCWRRASWGALFPWPRLPPLIGHSSSCDAAVRGTMEKSWVLEPGPLGWRAADQVPFVHGGRNVGDTDIRVIVVKDIGG